MCDEGRGVGPEVEGVRRGVYLDFAEAIERLGRKAIEDKYGNLFDMYARITGEDPYEVPMRIYPAVHYMMGGLWVDYDLQSTIPGLFVTGEANFSDHGANRLGASALMQGLADGYFVLPNTIRDYLADGPFDKVPEDHPAVVEAQQSVQARIDHFMNINGTRSVDSYHRELGNIMWEYCGMERTEDGLRKAIDLIRALRDDFWRNVKVLGTAREPQPVAGAGRPGGRLLRARRADVHRRAATGASPAAATSAPSRRPRTARRCATTTSTPTSRPGSGPARTRSPILHKENLTYEFVEMKQRSYK